MRMLGTRYAAAGATAAALVLGAWAGATRPARSPAARPVNPLVVVGIDGAEWSVIRELWGQAKLPNLRRIAERGTTATLQTAYGISPVIWTTMATGHEPRVHGITHFMVPTAKGAVPVSSSLRRVPALWNIASTAGLRVGVVSWWASWPAERVNGVVVSDRALLDVPDRVWPPEFTERFGELRRAALARPNHFGGDRATAERDQVTAEISRTLAAEGYDLLLVYFRGVDVASHKYWRHFRPAGFAPLGSSASVELANEVPRVYEATDEAIGVLLDVVPEANFLVVSDHGFRSLPSEDTVVKLDFERVLEALGFLSGKRGALDFSRTRVYGNATPPTSMRRRLRFALAGREPGATVLPGQREQVRRDLDRALDRVTWEDGSRAFRLRDPRRQEAEGGAELVAVLATERATERLLVDGQPVRDAVQSVWRVSGTHGRSTHGILLATGPDIASDGALGAISIHDIAPTILYALGLPVANDFAGTARLGLFTPEMRRRSPLRRISSWGKPHKGHATASGADEELMRELQALGYLR